MTVWNFLRQAANDRRWLPGMTFKTTLLGKVPYCRSGLGELEGIIPPELQQAAIDNGFQIEAADFRKGCYVVRIM